MKHKTAVAGAIQVDAWAQVPEGRDPEEFRAFLESIGNTVGEFNPDIGDHGSWHIGVLTEEK